MLLWNWDWRPCSKAYWLVRCQGLVHASLCVIVAIILELLVTGLHSCGQINIVIAKVIGYCRSITTTSPLAHQFRVVKGQENKLFKMCCNNFPLSTFWLKKSKFVGRPLFLSCLHYILLLSVSASMKIFH